MTAGETPVWVPCGDLRLEGQIREGDANISLVMLHPHPQMGGDMHNPIVTTICGAAASLGATTLRFNFRGTGASGGAYDRGEGEQDDAAAALTYMRARRPDGIAILGGYSFGGMVAARVAARTEVDALLLVSPVPAHLVEIPESLPTCILGGSDDAYVDAAALNEAASEGRRIVIAPGVDHFWWDGMDVLLRESKAFFLRLMDET